MPSMGDYRIRVVANNAEVSERTARRWRDTGDERWERYLAGFELPVVEHQQGPAPADEENGWDKLTKSDAAGGWIQPDTFTPEDAVLAAEELQAMSCRLLMALCREPAYFQGSTKGDWAKLDGCMEAFGFLAGKFSKLTGGQVDTENLP
jgi:hypothetical protein